MFFKNINKGIQEYHSTPGAVLLDVREKNEYVSGHIPGAINIPLSILETAYLPPDKDAPLFIYCLAGTRSGRAVSVLKGKGYKNVKNIGGINGYKGAVER